ncbi:hypothetical protein E2C01_070096 [Portunus trituberculatus]|uniref:Uncharacterized protein n=1 Tax=Portunus trituberculatus TaxID=210409 RepID=A0A5B7HRT2_PORTR|nr:hypothetical protein [Portunus trituberculatus]
MQRVCRASGRNPGIRCPGMGQMAWVRVSTRHVHQKEVAALPPLPGATGHPRIATTGRQPYHLNTQHSNYPGLVGHAAGHRVLTRTHSRLDPQTSTDSTAHPRQPTPPYDSLHTTLLTVHRPQVLSATLEAANFIC